MKPSRRTALVVGLLAAALLLGMESPSGGRAAEPSQSHPHLARAKVFLAAADYHRALDACLREVAEAPSAQSYLYLTYVYQALDGYVEHLAAHDRWVAVEQLYLSLTYQGPQDLTDPPDVLARIAKEVVQQSAQRQSDITAAMATRLDKALVERLWTQQAEWRKAHPDDWWAGVPAAWNW